MRLWNSLAVRFGDRHKRSPVALEALAEAYRDVFETQRTPTDAQKEMVLADLANASGFYRVSGPELPESHRAFADGARSVYGRIFRFTRMSAAEVRALEEAARGEAIADSEQGEM